VAEAGLENLTPVILAVRRAASESLDRGTRSGG